MNRPTTDIISDIRTGKAKMTRKGDTWTDTEKYDLLLQYFAGIDITAIAYNHQRTETAIIHQLIANNAIKNYSTPRKSYRSRKQCQCSYCKLNGTSQCLRNCKSCKNRKEVNHV